MRGRTVGLGEAMIGPALKFRLGSVQVRDAGVHPLAVLVDDRHLRSGVDPATIILEVTESIMIRNADASIPVLKQLRSLGDRIHMDDFGTGYSSLSYLHHLPLSGLKIDRSFVRFMPERRDYAAVLHAIVALARNLHIQSIAGGIEIREQAVVLQTMDCESAQGFLFSKPMPSAVAEQFLLDRQTSPITSALDPDVRKKLTACPSRREADRG